ncbi:MAG: family 43 glycosylhydrolase [Bacteroidota bacterium]
MINYSKELLLLTLSLLMILCSSCKNEPSDNPDPEPEITYENPVFEPSFADPTFLRDDDGIFYAYATEEDWNDGLGDKIIPIIKSTNLVDWEHVGNAFDARPDFVNDGQHRWVWSPDIVKHDNKYFLFYSLSYGEDDKAGIGISWGSSPEGPFTDLGELIRSDKIGVEHSIAPFFVEDEGKYYTFWGSFRGIYGIELEYDPVTPTFNLKGEKFQIAGMHFEGPRIFKKGEYYYFVSSNGHCCNWTGRGEDNWYNIRVAKSSSLKGPYFDKTGKGIMSMTPEAPHDGTIILVANEYIDAYVSFPFWPQFGAPGQNTKIITDDEGNDWMMYHAVDRNNPWLRPGFIRRPLMLSQIKWVDGWPVILNRNNAINPVFNE